jgi:hypothetical protein
LPCGATIPRSKDRAELIYSGRRLANL